jgi:hypothetical protein
MKLTKKNDNSITPLQHAVKKQMPLKSLNHIRSLNSSFPLK